MIYKLKFTDFFDSIVCIIQGFFAPRALDFLSDGVCNPVRNVSPAKKIHVVPDQISFEGWDVKAD